MSITETVVLGDAILHRGDWREVLPRIGPVDVILTDPPYSRRTHQGARSLGQPGRSPISFPHLTSEQFREFARAAVAATRRWVVMTCDLEHAAKLSEWGLPLVRVGAWIKPNGTPQFSGDRPGTGWEAVAILHRPGPKRWNGGGEHAVWTVPRVNGNWHPAEKPLALLLEWVRLFSEEGEVVLDPFMGSGTTGVASGKMGRRFVGIEIDKEYFDRACRRIEEAQKEPNLFAGVFEQRTLFDSPR